EEIGAPQPLVGLGDPVELVALAASEVAGVLPERIASPGNVFGVAGRTRMTAADLAGGATTFGFVPRAASFDVERVDRPGDDVEGIGTAHCLRRAAGDDPGDPVGHVRRNMGELGGAVGTELIKEHVQRGVVASGTSPHQPAAVMVDN